MSIAYSSPVSEAILFLKASLRVMQCPNFNLYCSLIFTAVLGVGSSDVFGDMMWRQGSSWRNTDSTCLMTFVRTTASLVEWIDERLSFQIIHHINLFSTPNESFPALAAHMLF